MYRRKSERWVKHVDFMIVDIIALQISFVLSYLIRNGKGNPYYDKTYLNIIVMLTIIDILVAVFFGSFKNVIKRGYYKGFTMMLKHVCMVELILTFYLFSVQSGAEYSRIIIYLTGIIYIFLGYAFRVIWKKLIQKRKTEAGKRSLLVITTREMAWSSIENIKDNNYEKFLIAGLVLWESGTIGENIDGVEVVTDLEHVLEYAPREWIDEVFINLPDQNSYPSYLADKFNEMGIVVHVRIIGSTQSAGRKRFIERMGGYTVLTTSINYVSLSQTILKRGMDIAGGVAGCLITVVLLLFLGPAIYIQSPGPIFFKQVRMGRNGKKFYMYKFRSMYLDAEERKAELMKQNRVNDGLMFKLDWDPRIIGSRELPDGTLKKGIGNFIREWSLDEFPQFFNVLKGDMSLVGTRPPTVDEWEKYELHHRARLAVKPGITGLWQVSGRSSITDFNDVVKLDMEYINTWSIGLDIRILFKTVWAVFGKEGSM